MSNKTEKTVESLIVRLHELDSAFEMVRENLEECQRLLKEIGQAFEVSIEFNGNPLSKNKLEWFYEEDENNE